MSTSLNLMEVREAAIRAHYDGVVSMLQHFDYAPRIAAPRAAAARQELSPGITATGRRFRTTTPGLAARATVAASGVQLVDRVGAVDTGDPLLSPVQASVLHALRRAIATALAVTDLFEERTALGQLKRDNRDGRLDPARRTE